jgi:sterol 3beta-glucosyltransferase
MKICLLCYGSRGDVQPFLALAVGLRKAGHLPTVAAPARFADLSAEYGIPFVPLAGDPAEISRRINDAGQNPFRMVRAMQKYIFGIAAQVAQQALAVCRDSDLVVHSFLFTTGAHAFARSLGIPDISAQTFPVFAPTQAFPAVAFPAVPSGWISYFSHWLTTKIFWYGGNSGYGRVRKSIPGTFPSKLSWPFRQTAERPRTPLLFAWSPSVIPVPAEWGRDINVTGYWRQNAESGYLPPTALADFLSAGEPPVCVSFGSMVNRNAEQINRLVLEALEATHQRAVILSGWGVLQGIIDSNDILVVEEDVPHDWLFPRCKVVIHHGGAGTTGAGLQAGVPNILIPFAGDQPFWGQRVRLLGAGPAPIPVRKLTSRLLIGALAEAETQPIRESAQVVSARLWAEDGVGVAVHLIEEHARRFRERRLDFLP